MTYVRPALAALTALALAGSGRDAPVRELYPVVHLPSKSAAMSLIAGADENVTGRYDVVLVGAGEWVKANPGGNTWKRADRTEFPDRSPPDVDIADGDLTSAGDLLAHVSTAMGHAASPAGDRMISGALDATRATRTGPLAKPGGAGAALPYAAQLDGQNRLTQLTVVVPETGGAAAGRWVIEISGYGAQTPQTKPA